MPVAPSAGAWIETNVTANQQYVLPSRPLRVRGLKHRICEPMRRLNAVAPSAGAWIETDDYIFTLPENTVAPSAGAWIETVLGVLADLPRGSRPLRVRGLKQN